MSTLLKTLWDEARAPDAPGPLRRDWVLVTALILLSAIEAFFSEDLVWRPFSIVLTAALALTLPWRRIHPLRMVAMAFGSTAATHALAIASNIDWNGLNTSVFLLILPYSLLRWGSGREAFLGLVVITVSLLTAVWTETTHWGEVFGASLFLFFPAALGASVRYQNSAQLRVSEQVRHREREQLARELHDTVAHHVSAIAIQAQAGRAVAATRAEAALEALEVIEQEASRTLTEMRHIVRALRDDGTTDLAPTASLADIERLARNDAYPLEIDVNFSGELDNLHATLASTLFRLTQESLTNAVRHARDVQTVTILVSGEPEQIRLTIKDDGQYVSSDLPTGLGLQGMYERAALLGGSLRAGPGKLRGWTVEATLPRHGAES